MNFETRAAFPLWQGAHVACVAGDALFVLFRGEEHAKHAAHAAWNMNRVLAAIGDIHLPAARARLRMSVGVHTGTFELVLTGGDSVSVVLAGAATDRVLELQGAAPAGRILVSAVPAGGTVRVVVEDSGPGIPEEHLPRVFDRFYKVDQSRTGTAQPSGSGLGLSIVRAIVQLHGGHVSASNRPEGGARFEVTLPAGLPATPDL